MALTDAVVRPAVAPAGPSPAPSPSRSMFSKPPVLMRPTTPTPVPQTPSRSKDKENRRRSWFGLVTPTRNRDKDRAVSAGPALTLSGRGPSESTADDNSIEELEPTPQRPQRSASATTADNAKTPSRRPWGVAPVADAAARNQRDNDSDSDYVLSNLDDDSDWEVTGTVRRKRTLRSRRQQRQQEAATTTSLTDTTPVRQKDLATLAILSRNNSTSTPKPKPLTSRIFSRTANESEPSAATSPESNPSNLPTLSSAITPSNLLPRRTSSIVDHTKSKRMTANALAPTLPPLLADRSPVNKPLPDLPPPPHDDGLEPQPPPTRPMAIPLVSAPNDQYQQPTSSSPLPPTDIVVTPSSPCDKDPFEIPFSRYAVERPFSAPPTSPQGLPRIVPNTPLTQSPTPSPSLMSGQSSSLGLGLPDRHPRRVNGSTGKPLPAIVSVSSPLPSSARSPSPATKVTFATMQGSHNSEGKDQSDKVKAPRPRSFSAMFSRSPLLNLDHTDDEEPSTSKFNWLGVRKTIKRRRSEQKLNQQRSPAANEAPAASAPAPATSTTSRPTNMSTPLLLGPPPAESSAAATSTRPASTPPQPPPDGQTPTSIASFVLPPVVQEEWWPAREWGEPDTPQRIPPAATPLSARTRASDTYTPDTPTDSTTVDDRDDSESKDSHGSSRRLPPSRTSSLLSTTGHALGSLPEGGLAPSASATPTVPPIVEQPKPVPAPPPRRDHNRRRSYSDAGRRSFVPMADGPPQHSSLNNSPRSNFLAALTGEPAKSPKLSRPASSSSTLVKMRSVFSIGGRSRSNSALRFGAPEEIYDGRDTPNTRPPSSASASSFLPSPALPPVRIRPEDVPQVSQLQLMIGGDDDRRVVLGPENPDQRSSASLTSTPRTSQSTTRRSLTADPHAQAGGLRATRARASTISSAGWSGQLDVHHSNLSTTGTFGHPSSLYHAGSVYGQSIHGSLHYAGLQTGSAAHLPIPTPTFPTASTPPRRPNSIRRLSTGLFRSGAVSPKPHGVVRSGSGPIQQVPDDFNPRDSSQSQSRSDSAMGMSTMASVTDKGLDKKDVDTTVHSDDTAESWLGRVLVINRRQLSTVLADSADKLHMDALRLYMDRFDFHHTALDVALRRLLMDLSLPKETQQIDRVIETFAQRYDVCEPGLFGTKDNTYVLAFSMMMLHTDAFNRHNKNKMTKADYVRNTRLDGVPETVLEAFYDNITFTPFVFIEDDNEASLAAVGQSTSSGPVVRTGKVDVYDMIAGGTIMTLRANVEALIPPESPFSCMGTQAFLDVDRLQRAFADAHPLSFVKSRPRRKSSVTMPTLPGADKTPIKSVPKEEIQTLKITKVGLITRKDDTHVNGKRPSGRKWKNWSVILTGSQLLFFKDTILALTLVEQIRSAGKAADGEPIVPRMTGFQPDEVLSVKECVAIYDRDYTEMPHTFRFIMPQGRQYLLQALDEKEMNDWLTLINYASTFKSAGIRMRAQAIDSGEAMLAGTAAAESHRKELASGGSNTPDTSTPPPAHARAVLFAEPDSIDDTPLVRPKLRRVGSLRSTPTPKVDIVGANDVVVGGGEQIEAVIGSVKAELAAGRGATRPMSMAPQSNVQPLHKSLRTEAIQKRVAELRESAGVIEKRLAENLRLGRNIALLTPFQKVTRDRIEAAVPELANQIRADRIELAKLHLWITMLLKDQERDEREWARVRHVALQAAAKSLRNGLNVMDRRATLAHPIAIPKLSLPDSEDPWPEPQSPGFTPISPGLMSPPSVSRGESSGSELPTTSRMSGMSGISAISSVSASDEPNSQRNSDASGSSDYELASEYLSASSVLSLQEELERHLSSDALATLISLNSASASPGSTGLASPPNGHGHAYASASDPGTVAPGSSSTSALATALASLPNRNSYRHSILSHPGRADAEEHLDETANGVETAEHWRNTRAATKVSLARMPRNGLGEIQSKKIGQSWI